MSRTTAVLRSTISMARTTASMARTAIGIGDTAYRTLVAADGAIYHWPMNEASGNLAALIGSTALTATALGYAAPGKLATNAGVWNGVNGTAATAAALDLTAYTRVVVEALMFIPVHFTPAARMGWEFSATFPGNAGSFAFFTDGGGATTAASGLVGVRGNVGNTYADCPRLPQRKWTHVAAVYDFTQAAAAEIAVYYDGVLQTLTLPTSSENTGAFGNFVLYVGSRAGSSRFQSMNMQHLAIYGGTGMTTAKILEHSVAATPVRTVAS